MQLHYETNNTFTGNKGVIEALENSSKELAQWLSNKQMKANADKCHFLTNSNEESNVCIDNNIIRNSKCEKLLAVKIYRTLNFNAHISNIGKKSGQKLSVLCKIIPYMGIQKRRLLLLNAHFMSQFSYRPLHCVKSVNIRSYSGPYSVRMRKNADQNNSENGHLVTMSHRRSKN